MPGLDGQFLKAMADYKAQINEDIETDFRIGADPYDNVARLKVCETIEKMYFRLHETVGDDYVQPEDQR